MMRVDDFVMTCGAIAPVDEFVVLAAWESMPRLLSITEFVQDPRFAIALFRAAINAGAMDGVRFVDLSKENLLEVMQAD